MLAGSSRKQESCRKTGTSALLTTPKPLTVWITTNWEMLKEMGIPNHLTCLLRNLYSGQETTVRTQYGTMDWFKTGKGVRQGCLLSPCLFNLHAEYIVQLNNKKALVGQSVQNPPATQESVCSAEDPAIKPGRSAGGGNGNPLQYSCLENPMDRGAWQASSQGCKE